MGYSLRLVVFSSLEIGKREKNIPKMLLSCALIFMLAAPALGTVPILLTTSGAGIATTTTTIGGGTVLMAALLGTVVKAKILRRLHNRSGRSIFPIHIPIFRRGKREAEALPVDDLTDQELEYILALLDNAPTYSV